MCPVPGFSVIQVEERDEAPLLCDRHVDNGTSLDCAKRVCIGNGARIDPCVVEYDSATKLQVVDVAPVVSETQCSGEARYPRHRPIALDVDRLVRQVDGPISGPANAQCSAQDFRGGECEFVRILKLANLFTERSQRSLPPLRILRVGDVEALANDRIPVRNADRSTDKAQETSGKTCFLGGCLHIFNIYDRASPRDLVQRRTHGSSGFACDFVQGSAKPTCATKQTHVARIDELDDMGVAPNDNRGGRSLLDYPVPHPFFGT